MTSSPHQSFSFFHNAWRRLKRNKGAMAGLVIIFLSIITGVFAYFIANDTTPNADRQIVEIQAKKPGYKKLLSK
jgi:peptide/nickel transport system permease protein